MRYFILCALAATACGSHHDGAGPADPSTPPYSLAITDASKLPPCDAGHEGQLVYIESDTKFKTCTSGSWNDITVLAARGQNGNDGKDGATVAETIATKYTCSGANTDSGLAVVETMTVMTSGTVFAWATLSGNASDQTTSAVYAKRDSKAATGEITVFTTAGSSSGRYVIAVDTSALTYSVKSTTAGSTAQTGKCLKDTY